MAVRAAACLAALCVLFFLACYAGTGDDRRNMRSFWSYPSAVREAARHIPRLADMVPAQRLPIASFAANLVVFSVVLALVGLFARPHGIDQTFLVLLVVGEGLNLFDLVVIDLLWWRRSPRVRLTGVGDPSLYLDPRPHLAAFLRGIPLFVLAAGIATLICNI